MTVVTIALPIYSKNDDEDSDEGKQDEGDSNKFSKISTCIVDKVHVEVGTKRNGSLWGNRKRLNQDRIVRKGRIDICSQGSDWFCDDDVEGVPQRLQSRYRCVEGFERVENGGRELDIVE